MIEANIEHHIPRSTMHAGAAYRRERGAILLDQLGKQKAAAAVQNIDVPEPSSRMEASMSKVA